MTDPKLPVLTQSESMTFTFYDEKLRELIGRDLGVEPMRVKVSIYDASEGRGASPRHKFVVNVAATCFIRCPVTHRDCTHDDSTLYRCSGSVCGRQHALGPEG